MECAYDTPEDELNKPEAGLPECPEDACENGCVALCPRGGGGASP